MHSVNLVRSLIVALTFYSQISIAQIVVKTNMGHSADIYDMDLSTDDKYLLTGAKDNTVRLWEVKTGREIYVLTGHTNLITSVSLSQDMKYAASGGWDKMIFVWNLTTGKLFKSIVWNSNVAKVKIDGARNLIYAADDKGYFMVFYLNSGELKHSFQAHTGAISDFDVNDRTKLLVTSSNDGQVKSWSLDTFQPLRTIWSKSQTAYHLAIVPTGDKVILGEFYTPNDDDSDILFIIDLNGNVLRSGFKGHSRTKMINNYYSLNDVRYSGSGSRFITAGRDGQTKVWREDQLTSLMTYETEIPPRSAALSKGGEYFFSTTMGRTIGMWGEDGEPVQKFVGRGLFLNDLAISPDQKTLVLAGASAYSFDLNTSKLFLTINWHNSENDRLNNNIRPISCITYSPDGKYLASGSGGFYSQGVSESTVRLFNAKDGTLFKTIEAHPKGLTSIAFSPTGSEIMTSGGIAMLSFATGSISSHAKAFNTSSGLTAFTFSGAGDWTRDVVVDPTSGTIAIASSTKELYLYASNGALLRKIMADQELAKLNFFQNGSLIIGGGEKGDLMIWEVSTGTLKTKNATDSGEISALAITSDYIVTGGSNGAIKIWKAPFQSPIATLNEGKSWVTGLAFSNNGKQLISTGKDGTAKFWDVASGTEQLTLIPMSYSQEWVAYTPEGYYYGTKDAIGKMVHYVDGLKTIGFDQFDMKYNRPDIILEKMGVASAQTISAYKHAWEKRVKKMGFDPMVIQAKSELNAPEITLNTTIPAFHTVRDQNFTFSIRATDKLYTLDRLLISVNGVPVDGIKGRPIDHVPSLTQDIALSLSSGKNVIKVSAMNEKGVESLAEQFTVTYTPSSPVLPDLHVIAIGVSKFIESDYNLTYADKDANDLAALLKNATGYGQVYVHSFRNEQATVANILSVRTELEKTKVDDEVVVFIASHGLLDKDLNYYIAMHDMQFDNPKDGGLRYDLLENLIDSIPARNKIMLIDACHSGEVDKDESKLTTSAQSLATTGVKSRGIKNVTINSGTDLKSAFELMKELFADLRRNNGSVVISSASGSEFAFESSEWQNGVFTYAVLEGIKSGHADADKNGSVSVSELRDYVSKRVVELTNGKQNPTSRTDNLESDFRVW